MVDLSVSVSVWSVTVCGLWVLAGQVEDGWGGGCSDSFVACWRTAEADHCDTQGHAGPTRGTLSYCISSSSSSDCCSSDTCEGGVSWCVDWHTGVLLLCLWLGSPVGLSQHRHQR